MPGKRKKRPSIEADDEEVMHKATKLKLDTPDMSPQRKIAKESEGGFEFTSPVVVGATTPLSTPKRTGFDFTSPVAVTTVDAPDADTPERASAAEPVAELTTKDAPKEAPKPVFRTLKNLPKPVPGEWNCTTCMIKNKPDHVTCAACQTAKPKTASAPPAAAAVVTATTVFKPLKNLLNLPAKAAGSWDCPTCMITNKPATAKCAACETAKPKAKADTESKPKAETAPMTKATATINPFSKFKQARPEGTWDCRTCMVQNPPTFSKCAACESPNPKPAAAPTATAPAAPVMKEFKPLKQLKNLPTKPAGSWDCPTCMISNTADKTKCLACETPNPTAAAVGKVDAGVAAASTSAGAFSFGTAATSASNFKFGASAGASATGGGFSFGAPAASSTASGFSFGTTSSISASGFSFGAPAAAAPSLGTSATDSATKSVGFSFGKPAEPEATPAPNGFSFGKPAEDSLKS